jgi:hypothetical protein
MKRFLAFSLFVVVVLSACTAPAATEQAANATQQVDITVFKAPYWGCCGDWSEYMRENGYTVKEEGVENLSTVKNKYKVPAELQSCHTAIVDGYIVEGHVPVAEIERLLTERPDILGLAVAGMPAGSPGMDDEGSPPQPFDVIAFDEDGGMLIFASY